MSEKSREPNIFVFFWVFLCGFAWLCVALCLWGCINNPGESEHSGAKISFLDVGQGLSVLLEQEGRFALYDAGPDSAGVWDSLLARGVDTLEWVAVSHNHRDHGGGLLELMDARGGAAADQGKAGRGSASPRVHIRRVYVGPDTSGGFVRDSLLRVCSRLGIPVDTLYRGDQVSLGDLTFRVLWPVQYLPVGENGASLVMRGSFAESQAGAATVYSGVSRDGIAAVYAGVSRGGTASSLQDGSSDGVLLLTGDLDTAAESRLLELSPDISAGLLQVGHHGSSGSSSLRFLNRVSPRLAVVSVGAGNSYGHPTEEVLRKLEYVLGDSAAISRTDLEGNISYLMIPGVGILKE